VTCELTITQIGITVA